MTGTGPGVGRVRRAAGARGDPRRRARTDRGAAAPRTRCATRSSSALSGQAARAVPAGAGAADIADVQSALLPAAPTASRPTPRCSRSGAGTERRGGRDRGRAAARRGARDGAVARRAAHLSRVETARGRPVRADAGRRARRSRRRDAAGPPVVDLGHRGRAAPAHSPPRSPTTPSRVELGLDIVVPRPGGEGSRAWSVDAWRIRRRDGRLATRCRRRSTHATEVADACVVHADDGGVPGGMRAGDVVVAGLSIARSGERTERPSPRVRRARHDVGPARAGLRARRLLPARARTASRSSAKAFGRDRRAAGSRRRRASDARGNRPARTPTARPPRAEGRGRPNVPIHRRGPSPRASCTSSADRARSNTSASCWPSPRCSSPSRPRSTTRSAARSPRRSSTGCRRRSRRSATRSTPERRPPGRARGTARPGGGRIATRRRARTGCALAAERSRRPLRPCRRAPAAARA